ncbi:MAG: DegT/DnrJ/EryC1/StrS family aminotransferase [Spirochaetales bacterium]|nr:DegT/DnrJ/EryC1/StrS family aminotransferase [Spirochaetales bacterium]
MIPLNDLARSVDYSTLREITGRVVSSGMFIGGKELETFERAFAGFCQAQSCIGVANGTDAIEIVLRALGIKTGDRVVCAANAGGYSATAIVACGAVPIFADIERVSLALDTDSTRQAIQENRPQAVILTHLYGKLAAHTDELVALCQELSIPLIEDCAQAHGANRSGKFAGTFGTAGTFSFYPTKNLGALGDAGAIVTDNAHLAGIAREIRQYGWRSRYYSVRPGRNSRMDEIQAAVLNARLPGLEERNELRREVARIYIDGLSGSPELPRFDVSSSDYVAHLFVIESEHRAALKVFLQQSGVQSEIHYPVPDYNQEWYRSLIGSQSAEDLPVTEWACRSVLSLPCFPELSHKETDHIIQAVRNFYEKKPTFAK